MDGIQLSLFGKMFPEHSPATTETTSGACSKRSAKRPEGGIQFLDLRAGHGNLLGRSWETDSPLHGDSSTRNTGEFPRDARESTLWQILEDNAPERYFLSARACEGVLRRAEKRGKALPKMLKDALKEAIALERGGA